VIPERTFKHQNNVVKIWQLLIGPPGGGAPSHGTTGTTVNPALDGVPKSDSSVYSNLLVSFFSVSAKTLQSIYFFLSFTPISFIGDKISTKSMGRTKSNKMLNTAKWTESLN